MRPITAVVLIAMLRARDFATALVVLVETETLRLIRFAVDLVRLAVVVTEVESVTMNARIADTDVEIETECARRFDTPFATDAVTVLVVLNVFDTAREDDTEAAIVAPSVTV